MGLLCARYNVWLQDRATRTPKQGCDYSKVKATGTITRDLNGTSDADFQVIDPSGSLCCDCDYQAGRDELVVERVPDKTGKANRVWVGPVTSLSTDNVFGFADFKAYDRSWWWDQNPLINTDRIIAGRVPEAEAWARVRRDQDSVNPSGLLIQAGEPTGRLFDLEAFKYDQADGVAADFTAVNWTVVGDRLYGPGLSTVGRAPFATLVTSKHWTGNQTVIEQNAATAAAQVVVFGQGNSVGVFPPTPSRDPWGVQVKSAVLAGVEDPVVLTREAERLYRIYRVPARFLVTSQGTLNEEAPVEFDDLIPGRVFTVQADEQCGEQFTQDMELVRVVADFQCVVEGGEPALRETRVAVDLAPVGFGEVLSDRIST